MSMWAGAIIGRIRRMTFGESNEFVTCLVGYVSQFKTWIGSDELSNVNSFTSVSIRTPIYSRV